jgi:hypothetical protein
MTIWYLRWRWRAGRLGRDGGEGGPPSSQGYRRIAQLGSLTLGTSIFSRFPHRYIDRALLTFATRQPLRGRRATCLHRNGTHH